MIEAAVTAKPEVKRNRYNKVRAKVLALPLLAGLTIAACSGGSNEGTPTTTAAAATRVPEVTTTLASTTTSREISRQSSSTAVTPNSPSTTGSANPNRSSGIAGCNQYFDISSLTKSDYEVCVVYVVNSAEIALQAFYKFGNNRVGYLSGPARQHFETRYWDQARSNIEHNVDAWPKASNLTGNRVEENVTIVSVSTNLQADRALLQTQERWKVTSEDNKVLLDEPLRTRDITMCQGKLPGHPTQSWFVVSYSQQPNFDCVGFNAANGIEN